MDAKVQSDFPIDWEDDHYVSRREFFRFLTLASGGLAVGSTAMGVWSRTSRDERRFEPAPIARLTELEPGQAMAFTYPRPTDICILVHRPMGGYVAYSRRCTHLSCPVYYQADRNRLYCPCHNGAFSVDDGRVLQGPPPHPLPMVLLEIRDDQIWAVGVRRGEEHA